MRLLLIRHGRSAHAMVRRVLDRAAAHAWLAAYDEAGLAADDRPPPEVIAEVARACVLATSDMPRALASAALLAPGRAVHASPLFREEPLPLPPLASLWMAPYDRA